MQEHGGAGDGGVPAAAGRGYAAVAGTAMLLHQAARQVELMTGQSAPLDAMRAALEAGLRTGPIGGPAPRPTR